jgi:hypothetical protein
MSLAFALKSKTELLEKALVVPEILSSKSQLKPFWGSNPTINVTLTLQ